MHTKTPWVVYEPNDCVEEYDPICILSEEDHYEDGNPVINNGNDIAHAYGPDKLKNAKRIVACVNACEGIPTHELEQANYVHAYREVLAKTAMQRDELLSALKDVTRILYAARYTAGLGKSQLQRIERAEASIKKAEE